MLKGYQRKLIMIRTKESSVFESAFFILRQSSCDKGASGDMISEANRILVENGNTRKALRQPKLWHIFAAAGIGFLLGAAVVGGIWLGLA